MQFWFKRDAYFLTPVFWTVIDIKKGQEDQRTQDWTILMTAGL